MTTRRPLPSCRLPPRFSWLPSAQILDQPDLRGNNSYLGTTSVEGGQLRLDSTTANTVKGNVEIGTGAAGTNVVAELGTVGPITALAIGTGSASLAPGQSLGRLSSGSVVLTPGATFEVELNDPALAVSDQLAVTGTVDLANARLQITPGPALPADASWTIIENDGTEPVAGTFFEIPEGSEIAIGSHEYRLTYQGGDGNDVVIEGVAPLTYSLKASRGSSTRTSRSPM